MTDKLNPFTFKSTGVEIAIAPVSNVLIAEVKRACPKPLPPFEKVLNADGTYRDEPNPDNPNYAAMVSDWQEQLEEAIRRLCIKRGVVLHLNDAQKAEVAELRAFMRDDYKRELDADDKYVYVAFIAIGGNEDYQDLINAVLRRPSDPKSASG